MKKKKIVLFVFLIVGVLSLVFIYNKKINLNKNKLANKSYAIYVKENNSSSYINSKSIPKGSYLLNQAKSFCENNGEISSYDNVNGVVGFSFIGSDRCTLYFDEDSIAPTISEDLKVENDILTVTLNDNVMLKSYGLSSSSNTEPEEWFNIPSTPYTLSTSITSNTPYLWVKDAAGNTKVSSEISFGPKGWETILLNNSNGKTDIDSAINYIKAKGTPTFTTVATTNEGMYATEDDLGTSYYFRGAVDNNWVKFGEVGGKPIYWRIIRVNGDGSIRMIYTGTTAPTESTKVVMTGIGTQINATVYAFNSSINKAEYVGYQYIEGEQHGYGECNGTSASCTVNGKTVYNSTIKQAIDEWYAGTTLETDSSTKALVSQDQIFCNDRTASTSNVPYSSTNYTTLTSWNSTGTEYYYGARGRLNQSKSPILTCPTASDKFTANASNGNGALTYPVGLITADEVAMAGGVYGSSNINRSYYLYTNQYYWSGSPYFFERSRSIAFEFQVDSSGTLNTGNVDLTYGARPVVSLSSEAKLSGDGTWNNPYVVEN